MSDHASFDLSSAAAMLIVIVVTLAIAIRLIPVLFQAVWNVMPGALVVVIIIGVLRGMLKKLLG